MPVLLVVLATGCSSEESSPVTKGEDWVLDADLPVPVLLGSGGMVKAPVTGDNMSSEIFRFFAADAIAEADLRDDDGMGMHNFPARYDGSGFTFLDASGRPHEVYYPLGSDVKYLFYGYCIGGSQMLEFPYEISSEMITVEVPVTGHGDILCGSTSVGVNGQSVREAVLADPSFALNMSFRHVTAGVSFCTVLDGGSAFPDDADVHVTSLVLMDEPATARLCLIDRSVNNAWKQGCFLPSDADGQSVVFEGMDHIVSEIDSDLCDDIFIVPCEKSLKVAVTIVAGGVGHEVDITDEIAQVNASYGLSGYEAGKIYRYRLVFGYSDPDGFSVRVEAGR